VTCYEKATEIDPKFVYAWNNKGVVLDKLGKYDEAIKCYDKATEIDSKYLLAWTNKAKSLIALSRYPDAEQCYMKASELEPRNVNLLNDLCTFYSESLYDHNKALQMVQKAYGINPDDLSTRANLAETLLKVGNYKKSREQALQVLRDTRGIVYQHIMQFLIFSSYVLGNDVRNASKEFVKFLDSYIKKDGDLKIEENQWSFKGLIHSIGTTSSSLNAKFLLLTLINLMEGKIERQKLSFFQSLRQFGEFKNTSLS
jgi:Tfp pilus assembly protein PilF